MTASSFLHYRFPHAERCVAVYLAAPELGPLIESFYAGYRCPAPHSQQDVARVLRLERDDGAYRVSGPNGDWRAVTPGEAVLYYEYELTAALLEDTGSFVQLHGAAVCTGSRCLLLLGGSGAGKSTLALGLFLGGRQILADDALLIDPLSGEVQPFDRSVRVHEASLRGLGVDPAQVERASLCRPYLWLSPRAGVGVSEPSRPSSFVFLESDTRLSCERLSAAETLVRLMVARLEDVPERDFKCLARLAASVPGYRLAFEGLSDALARLDVL
ncbi:MAG: hypothetical protein AMS25_03390 [Gemmatimonas sp. SM23_52]|nr:MAG: hypothetical protein AMS25_03390 [Gemmatimonas sp. SM23_52]